MKSFEKFASEIFAAPRKSILLPAAVAFTVAYPFLYSTLSAFNSSSVHQILPDNVPSILVKQSLVYTEPLMSPMPHIRDALSPLLDGLGQSGTLHDDQDLQAILASPPQQGHSHRIQLPYLFTHTDYSLNQLEKDFPGPHANFDGSLTFYLGNLLISKDSNCTLLSYIYQDEQDGDLWDHLFISNFDNTKVRHEQELYADSGSHPTAHHHFRDSSSPNQSSSWPAVKEYLATLVICSVAAYSAVTLYMAVAFSNISVIRSKSGLFVAYLAQIILSVSSAGTLVHVIYPTFFSTGSNEVLLILLAVSSHSMETMFRFLHAIGKMPLEASPQARILAGAKESWPISGKRAAFDLLLLSLAFMPFTYFGDYFKAACLFIFLVIVVDYALHITYFTAVVSVDLSRCELEDLIMSDLDEDPFSASESEHSSVFNNSQAFHIHSIWKLRFESFIYFRYRFIKTKLPSFSTVGILFYVWLTGPSQKNHLLSESQNIIYNYLIPESLVSAERDSAYLSYRSLLSYIMLDYDLPLKMFCPIILKISDDFRGISSYIISFSSGSFFLKGTVYELNVTSIIEFVSCLSFILSLSGIVMSVVLPKDAPHLEETKPSFEEAQYSFKDLVGSHALDVLKIVTNGKWFATMSLDKKVCVWKPAANSNRVSEVFEVPLSADSWPISRIVLNGHNHMVAVFSPGKATIKVWNFGKSYLNYFYSNPALASSRNVINAYFCGKDLAVITNDGSMILINDRGEDQTFNISGRAQPLTTIDERGMPASPPEMHEKSEIIVATKLATPLLHEQLVFLSDRNEIIVAVHVGKNWRFRRLQLLESLSAVQSLHDGSTDEFTYPKSLNDYYQNKRFNTSSTMFAVSRPLQFSGNYSVVFPLPQLNMVLLASDVHASLLDVFSGTVLRHFQLGHAAPNTIKAFHSQPTHCRFCGCTSIESISVAYTDAEDEGTVIVHTLQIENRSKNTICLRVERDPREIRCLGFEASTEHHHWITRVEGWDTTDMNMIMGVRRLEPEVIEGEESDEYPSLALLTAVADLSLYVVVQALNVIYACFMCQFPQETRPLAKPPLNSTWEGWAMSASGQVSYYNIPDVLSTNGRGESNRLLIKKIGPVTKYGHKSIAVTFGNVIKVLYFGREEIQNELDDDGVSQRSGNHMAGSTRKRRPRGIIPTNSFNSVIDKAHSSG